MYVVYIGTTYHRMGRMLQSSSSREDVQHSCRNILLNAAQESAFLVTACRAALQLLGVQPSPAERLAASWQLNRFAAAWRSLSQRCCSSADT